MSADAKSLSGDTGADTKDLGSAASLPDASTKRFDTFSPHAVPFKMDNGKASILPGKEGSEGSNPALGKDTKSDKDQPSKKSNNSGRTRRDRKDHHAGAMDPMYGWDVESQMWNYPGVPAMRYGMEHMGLGAGMQYMPDAAMDMDTYMNPIDTRAMDTYLGRADMYTQGFPAPFSGVSPTPQQQQHQQRQSQPQPQTQPTKKTAKDGSEGLSVHAKPWSPSPESTVRIPTVEDNKVDINPASLVKIMDEDGNEVDAPAPMVPKETSANPFLHSFLAVPRAPLGVELEFFNYECVRCPQRTLYGRLSSRKPDVIVSNIAPDVPPMCLAHLLEQVGHVRIAALVTSESTSTTRYDVWLDRTAMANSLNAVVSGALWMCPMFHGYAVFAKNEKSKAYLGDYLKQLNDIQDPSQKASKFAFVNVKEV